MSATSPFDHNYGTGPFDFFPAGAPPATQSRTATNTDTPPSSTTPQGGAGISGVTPQMIQQVFSDLEKDPRYIDANKNISDAIKESQGYLRSAQPDIANLKAMPPPPPAPKFNERSPQIQDFAVTAMPWMMVATALGGRAAKLSGLNMMSAMTGMMKGAQTGQKIMFDQAYQHWQDNYKLMMDDWRNQMAVYNANLEWRKGKVDADFMASKAAAQQAGLAEDQLQNVVGVYKMKMQAYEQMVKYGEVMQRFRETNDIRNTGLLIKAQEQWQKSGSGYSRVESAIQASHDAYSRLPYIFEKYKQATNEFRVPMSWDSFFSQFSNDPEVQKFKADTDNLKPTLVGIELPTGSRGGNMFLHKLISENVPRLWAQGKGYIDQQLRLDMGFLNEAHQFYKNNMDMWGNTIQKLGGEPPEIPTYQFPETQIKPEGAPQASTGWGEMTVR